MLLQIIVLIVAVLLALYRVKDFRKRGLRASAALGFALNRRSITRFIIGAAIGALAISSIFLVEWSTGLLQIFKINAISVLREDCLYFAAKPLIEEFVFRCAILGALLLWIPQRFLAVLIAAALFGSVHIVNAHAGFLSVFSTMLGGVAYGCAFLVAEQIWFPLGLHIAWNFFQARVFGFALSGGFSGPAPLIQQHDLGPAILTGGPYGPEGGLLGIYARFLVLGCLVAWIICERRKFQLIAGAESSMQ